MFGVVLARSLRLWLRYLTPLLVLGMLASLPSYLPDLLGLLPDPESDAASALALGIVVVGTALGTVLDGCVTGALIAAQTGQPVSFGRSIALALSRLPALLGLGIIVGVGQAMGLVLILPALWLMAVWYVAGPVMIVERLDPVATLTRAAQLSAGERWSLFGLGVVIVLGSSLPTLVLADVLPPNTPLHLTVELAVTTLFASLGTVTTVVAYHELRLRKAQDTAGIFD
jgi:hypothetical protein